MATFGDLLKYDAQGNYLGEKNSGFGRLLQYDAQGNFTGNTKKQTSTSNRTIDRNLPLEDQVYTTGGKQIGGWYDNPKTGKNERYWGTIGNQEIFISNPNADINEVYALVANSLGLRSSFASPEQNTNIFLDNSKQSVIDATLKATDPLAEADKRAAEFDKNNPFAFDEVLATESARERLDPYYQAELQDFTEGIQIRRRQSEQEERSVLNQLNVQTQNLLGDVKRQVTDALDATRKGFAGAGLFLSGQRLREEGKTQIRGQEQQERGLADIDVRRQSTLGSSQANQGLLNIQERSGKRNLRAEQTTALTTDVEQQKQEQEAKRQQEKQQYVFGGLDTPGSKLFSMFGLQ